MEQDHRRIKHVTDQILGFKNTTNVVEYYAMLRKNQFTLSEISGRIASIVDQSYAIAT